MRYRTLRRLLPLVLLPALSACENSATAYSIEGSQHALILVREQSYFWDSQVKQAIVASRLPQCQKRVAIHPGGKVLVEMSIYEAGDRLWALQQGNRWYLASTERCLVQDWDKPADAPLGPAVGSFRLRDGVPVFEAAAASAPAN